MTTINTFYDTCDFGPSIPDNQISNVRKQLLKVLNINQNNAISTSDIKFHINNPVLSYTSRHVGYVSPRKKFSYNE